MLAPAAPHITEELWSRRLAAAGAPWSRSTPRPGPSVDPAAVVEATREIPVQVNGKLRDKVVVAADATHRRHRGRGPRPREDPGDPRRPAAGPGRPGRRRQAGQPRRPVTLPRTPVAFDRHLDATAPAVADIARALRVTVLALMPDAVETFDAADGLLAIGRGRSMRDFLFAIIPHTSWVNLQLADGADLPERGRPDRGHRQADPPRQGAVGRGRRRAVAASRHRGAARTMSRRARRRPRRRV